MQEKPIELNLTVQQQENLPLWIKAFEKLVDIWKNHNINKLFSMQIIMHEELPNETTLEKEDLSYMLELNVLSNFPAFHVSIQMNDGTNEPYHGGELFFSADKCEVVTWYSANISDEFAEVWQKFMETYGYDVEKDISLDGRAAYEEVDSNYSLKVLRDWTEFATKQDMRVAPAN